MGKLESVIIILCLFIYGSSAISDVTTYNCKIKHVYSLSDKGTLNTSNWQSDFEGDEFVVLKGTGEIKGKTLTTISAKEIKVINSGSNESSFKAIANFNEQFQLLEIQEFKPGKSKPFIALSMGGAGIVTGICK